MKYYLAGFLFTCIVCSGCSLSPLSHKGMRNMPQRTVTIYPKGKYSLPDVIIASSFIRNQGSYLPQYVRVNYDTVFGKYYTMKRMYSAWGRARINLSNKRQCKLFARAAGTDHVIHIKEKAEYGTVSLPDEEMRLYDNLLSGLDPTSKSLIGVRTQTYREAHNIKKVTYVLRYRDGHTGKLLWKLKAKYPGMYVSNNDIPVTALKKKFEKKFPYRIAEKK